MLLILVGTNIYWVKFNTIPQSWDQSGYLLVAKEYKDALVDYGPIKLVKVFSRSFGYKAPLISLLPLPSFLIFGPNPMAAMLSLNLLVILMIVFLYLLFKSVADQRTALLGTVLTATMPIMYGLSREFLVEYGLTVLVVMWIYFSIISDHFQRRIIDLTLGLLLGLGLLMKINFPLYVLGPTAIILIKRIQTDGIKMPKKLVIDISMILIPGLLIASTWYARNLSTVTANALNASFGSDANMYAAGLLQFWRSIIRVGISFYLFSSLVILTVLVYARKPGRIRNIFKADENCYILAFWFAVPFIILSLGINKQDRFMLPILPVVGLVVAKLFFRVVPKKAVLPAVLFCVIPVFNFTYTTFPLGDRLINIADFPLISYEWEGLAHRPIHENWRVEEILGDISADAQGQNTKVTMVLDHFYLNAATLEFYRNILNYPMIMGTIAYLPYDKPVTEIVTELSSVDYIMAKTGNQGPNATNIKNDDVRNILMSENSDFLIIKKYELPDDSMAIIFKHK